MATKGKTAIPEPFEVTEAMRSWARVNAPGVDVAAATLEMIDYARGRDWRMADWQATWRNWIRKGVKASNRRAPMAAPESPAPRIDNYSPPPVSCGYEAVANRILYIALRRVGGVPKEFMPELVAGKKKLAARFREIGKDIPADEQRRITEAALDWVVGLCRKARGAAIGSGEQNGKPQAAGTGADRGDFTRIAEVA